MKQSFNINIEVTMRALPFLEYAAKACAKGRRTAEAVNFDEKLLRVAKFHQQKFDLDKQYAFFDGMKPAADGAYCLDLGPQHLYFFACVGSFLNITRCERYFNNIDTPETLDDFLRACQRMGIELKWSEAVIEKYFFSF